MAMRLSNKLTLLNTLTKVLIFVAFAFLLPQLISNILIVNTDNRLWLQKESTLQLVDSLGIDNFIDPEYPEEGYGNYGQFQDDFVSIFPNNTTELIDTIEYAEVEIESKVKTYRIISSSFRVKNQTYLLEIGKSIESIFEVEFIIKQYAIILLIIILAITTVFDLITIKQILNPLNQFILKLRHTRKPGVFNYEPIDSTTYDFRYLEKTYLSLMKRIEKSFNQEREFIGNVSHELLTPISIIQTKLENLIINSDLNDEQLIKVIESKKTLGRLTRIVKTLLMISRIENEEYINNKLINLSEICHDLIEEIEIKATSKNQKLSANILLDDIHIKGNKELIFTMLFNLLNNAIKYTPHGGSITIQLEKTENTILKISDTGIGIPKEKLKDIFSRHKKFSSDSNSFGLGLALVKRISDYHNIKIKINSKEKTGTEILLIFP